MPLWQRRRPQHPQCYFCSTLQQHLERSNAVQRFVCATCGSYNALSPSGAPIDDERPAMHWDSAIPSNALSLSKRASSTSSASRNPTPSQYTQDQTFFCPQCRRHQSLQLYLLGAYYDNTQDDSAEDQVLQHRLQEYKASLDSRYPTLCAACAPAVSQELARRNRKARADILNHLVISNSSLKQGSAPPTPRRRDPRATFHWRLQGIFWRLKGLLWALQQLSSMNLYLLGVLRPNTLADLHNHPSASFIIAFASSTFLISFWQPLWSQRREKAAASPDPRLVLIQGQRAWIVACFCAFFTRFLYISLLLFFDLTQHHLQAWSATSLFATTVSLFWAFRRQHVGVQDPRNNCSPSQPSKTPHAASVSASSPQSSARSSSFQPDAHPEPVRPHPLFGDWQTFRQAQSSTAVPMDVDEVHKVEVGTAGHSRTPLEDLLAGTDLRQNGPFS